MQLVIEGNLPNLDVTAPGGILGLALMYLQTNDRSVAALFDIPATAFALDLVRPDFILLRMLGRCLVLWDSIRPTATWIGSQLPPLIKVCHLDRSTECLSQKHCRPQTNTPYWHKVSACTDVIDNIEKDHNAQAPERFSDGRTSSKARSVTICMAASSANDRFRPI